MFGKIKTVVCIAVLAVISAGIVFSAEKPKSEKQSAAKTPRITVSKETTRFTRPLRDDGSLDCLALLNEIASKDVTPENNAAVLIWQAVGPKEIPQEHREKFFKKLGAPCPPEEGDYLIELHRYSDALKSENEKTKFNDRLLNQFDEAMKKPWSESEYPELADFLQKNEKPLKLILEAAQRPRLYSPLVPTSDEILSAMDINLISPLRDSSRLLVARSMRNLRKGQEKEAWRDLLASYRLGRLRSQGPWLIDLLVGSCLEAYAADGMAVFASNADITADQLQKYLADLRELPVGSPIDEIYGTGERIFYIGSIYDIAFRPQSLTKLTILHKEPEKKALEKLARDPQMDWNEVLRVAHEGFDFTLPALKLPNFPEANRALSKNHAEDRENLRKTLEPENLKKALSSQATPREKAECFVTLMADDGLLEDFSILFPPTRMKAKFRLARLALALSAYRGEHHAYPAKLAYLMPKYLPDISNDPFGECDFHYKPEKNGYLLYSVGRNGIDDGGKNYAEEHLNDILENKQASEAEKSADDIAIRTPSTNLKK